MSGHAPAARQSVATPEQVELHLPLAGPGPRVLAFAIDFVLLAIGSVALFTVIFIIALAVLGEGWMPDDPEELQELMRGRGQFVLVLVGIAMVAQFVVNFGYFVVSELTMGGQSLGKRVVRLRVVRDGGYPLTASASLLRNFLRIVDLLPGAYLVGLVVMMVSREHKRVGDYVAGTVVVRIDEGRLDPEPFAGMSHLELAGRHFQFDRALLARLTDDDLFVLRRWLQGRSRLSRSQAGAAEERLVTALARRLGAPPPAPEERHAYIEELFLAARDYRRRG